eukprot:CAMPEP_0206129594 /NCGR_PEP_ID=MMETSP1472-20131121/37006_1 /ASSEMBLY_ACC=CAM_ASM_001108 /TAXON_ID=41880 /ORGANISM="Pycnococcus provasolii, Strain RCC251" /LENGTH=311 /DNA_ID=CAMNT_0053520865 /DNA_START=71 /DNA_END=1009 /DNA_ORIENTATION=+
MNTHPRTPSFKLSSKAAPRPRASLGRLRDVSVQVAQLPRSAQHTRVGGGYRGNNNHAKEQHADDAFYGDDAGSHPALAGWKYFEMLRRYTPPAAETAERRRVPTAVRDAPHNNVVTLPTAAKPRHHKLYRLNIGICLCNEYNEVFVARRSDDGASWQMPQGGIRLGESPLDACIRELTEETGLRGEHVEFVQESRRWLRYCHDFSCHDDLTGKFTDFDGQSQRWFLFRLRPGAEASIDLEAEWKRTGGLEAPEFTEWRWMDLSNIPDQVPPFKRSVYRRVADEFGLTFSLMSIDMDDDTWLEKERRSVRSS